MLTICGNHINAEHPQPVILPSSSLTGSLCFVHSEYAAQCQCDNRDTAAEQKSNSSLESAAVKACCGESHCGHARSSLMAKGNDKYVKAYLCADLGCLFSICQCLLEHLPLPEAAQPAACWRAPGAHSRSPLASSSSQQCPPCAASSEQKSAPAIRLQLSAGICASNKVG